MNLAIIAHLIFIMVGGVMHVVWWRERVPTNRLMQNSTSGHEGGPQFLKGVVLRWPKHLVPYVETVAGGDGDGKRLGCMQRGHGPDNNAGSVVEDGMAQMFHYDVLPISTERHEVHPSIVLRRAAWTVEGHGWWAADPPQLLTTRCTNWCLIIPKIMACEEDESEIFLLCVVISKEKK